MVSSRFVEKTDTSCRGSTSGRYYFFGEVSPLRSNSYANAKGWDGLTYAFTESLKNSSLNEMILLLHTSIPGPRGWRLEYVRPVYYNRLDNVPKLLLSTTWRALDNEQGGDYEEEIDEIQVKAAKVIQGAYRRHLEWKQAGAARKIQAAYCRHLKRKRVVRQGIDAIQAHYWHLLRRRSMEMEWSRNSQYYLLFRVPLAYILVCLDATRTFAESKKKEVRKRLVTEDPTGLEELMEVLRQHRCDDVDCALCYLLV